MNVAARGLILPGLAALTAAGLLAGLGTWQVHRLAWKLDLIATVEARTHLPPRPAPGLAEAAALEPTSLDFVPVVLDGRWIEGIEAHVHAILGEPKGPFGGPGVWVMAPLARDDGSIVWINRGFVPVERKAEDGIGRRATGRVEIEGLMRRPEPRGAMTPADDVARNLWFVRDPAALASAFGLDPARVAPFTVDASARATPPGGLPQAGETRLVFANDHLGYAITWYGLALTALGVFAAHAGSVLRRKSAPRAPERAV